MKKKRPDLWPQTALELNETLVFEDIQIVDDDVAFYQETWVPVLKVLAKVIPILPAQSQDAWCAGQHILPSRYHVFIRGENRVKKNLRIRWRDSVFRLSTSPIYLDHFQWLTFIIEEI